MNTLTLNEYIEAVQNTLQYWLDIHTKADAWARAWCIDDDWQYTYQTTPVIKNNYFEFDLRANVTKHIAKRAQNEYGKCPKCGGIWDYYSECPECEKELRRVSVKELAEWMQEIVIEPSDFDIEEAMINDGFKVYRAALKDYTRPIEKEIKECLKQFKGDRARMLAAAAWANHIAHVHGNVISDYGNQFNLDYKTIDAISQQGIENYFGPAAVSEFVNS